MPTYAYRCSNGHQYETREGFDAPARQSCITCGEPAKRVLFPPPIVFKGRGFYITDSRKGDSATISDTSPPASATPPTTPAKEESKPAAAATSGDD